MLSGVGSVRLGVNIWKDTGAVAATSTYLGTSTLSVTFEELFQRLYFQKQGLNKVSKKKFIFMEKNQSAFTNRLFIKD